MPTTNPAKAEALGERISFTWHDTEFTVLPTTEWPYEALEAFEAGKITQFLAAVLGEEEHNHFKSLHPKVSELDDFVITMQKALGIEGN